MKHFGHEEEEPGEPGPPQGARLPRRVVRRRGRLVDRGRRAAHARRDRCRQVRGAKNGFTFVQISDTHVGFHKDANPDVVGSLRRAIGEINALPRRRRSSCTLAT